MFWTVDGSLDPGRQLWYIYCSVNPTKKKNFPEDESIIQIQVKQQFEIHLKNFQNTKPFKSLYPSTTSGIVMHQYVKHRCVYSDVLISAKFAVRKRVKKRFAPRSTIRLSTGLGAVMLPCSCASPSDSDQGFYCCTQRCGGLEPNRHIFRPGGRGWGAIESRDIIMKCKLEYCFYYKAKQMRLCRDSHQRCLCDD